MRAVSRRQVRHKIGVSPAEACCTLYPKEFVKALNLDQMGVAKNTRLGVRRYNLILL